MVGARAPGTEQNFATCVVFLLFLTHTKRRKMAFFEGLLGGGGYPPELGLDSRGRGQGRVGLAALLTWWTGGQGGGEKNGCF